MSETHLGCNLWGGGLVNSGVGHCLILMSMNIFLFVRSGVFSGWLVAFVSALKTLTEEWCPLHSAFSPDLVSKSTLVGCGGSSPHAIGWRRPRGRPIGQVSCHSGLHVPPPCTSRRGLVRGFKTPHSFFPPSIIHHFDFSPASRTMDVKRPLVQTVRTHSAGRLVFLIVELHEHRPAGCFFCLDCFSLHRWGFKLQEQKNKKNDVKSMRPLLLSKFNSPVTKCLDLFYLHFHFCTNSFDQLSTLHEGLYKHTHLNWEPDMHYTIQIVSCYIMTVLLWLN